MKAIVVTDQAAGTAGMKLVERPEPQAAINDAVVSGSCVGISGTDRQFAATQQFCPLLRGPPDTFHGPSAVLAVPAEPRYWLAGSGFRRLGPAPCKSGKKPCSGEGRCAPRAGGSRSHNASHIGERRFTRWPPSPNY